MRDYYCEALSGERLRMCYELASPRVRRYLEAEIEFVLARVSASDRVLELGCGYGRVLRRLIPKARAVFGIDTSRDSLRLARETVGGCASCHLAEMDAVALGFRGEAFDIVLCIQNGISAFGVDAEDLIREAARLVRPGGRVLLSSYSDRFWEDRLEWFRIQAAHGLLGAIDEGATGDGVIACKDGFRAGTTSRSDFASLMSGLEFPYQLTEVDGSSLFCEVTRT